MKTEKKSYISVLCCLFICCIVSCVNENDAYEQHKGALAFNISVVQINDEVASTRSALPAVNAMHNCVLTSQSGDSVFARYQSLGVNDFHNVQKATRGIEVTTNSFYKSFGVTAYTHTGNWVASTSNSPYVDNLEATSTNGTYMLNSHYWPGSTKNVSFFAYAPYKCSGATISNTSGTPTISYTVPSEAKNQNDLLIASTKNIVGNGQSSVPLQFSHALCGVKFAVGTMDGVTKIDKIVISGVNNSGTIAIDGTSWTGVSGSATYTLTLNKEVSGKNNIDITTTTDNNILFLMPQTVPSGATLTVTVDGVDYSMSIASNNYPKGGMVTYKLSTTEIKGTYEFNITPTTSTLVAQTGGTASYDVISYINYADGTTKAVGWTSSITPGATSNKSNGNGGTSAETITVTAENNSISSDHTTELRNRTDINKFSGKNPYNLSNPTGDDAVINTANCYVIGRKGNYSIPLVYGNAIKDGKTNSMAYGTGTYNGTNYNSQNFVTHLDKKVIDPYIYKNTTDGTTNGKKFAPDRAELIWQDAQSLITSVSYNSSTKMVNFTVGANLQQGNAIIAVKQGTTVLWSWHIWITDRDMDVTVPTKPYEGQVAEFMQVPLGWCDAYVGVSPRALTLSLKQNNSGYTASCITSQQGADALSGNAPFYSWGRKDPICPSTRNTQSGSTRYYIDKMLYDQNNGNLSITLKEISSGTYLTMGETIQNPGTFFVMGGNYYLPKMNDLWNSCYGETVNGDIKNSDVVKTIYDPSPVGYKIPTVNVFTGFTSTGDNSEVESEWNLSNSTTINNGLSFYTQGWKYGLLDYWPTSGNRISYGKDSNGNLVNGKAENVGNDGRYWSADLISEGYGYRFRFWQFTKSAEYTEGDQHRVFPLDYEVTRTGTYVRPVKE